MTSFSNKVSFVTGGGSGLGRSLCEELARRGSICVVSDVNIQAAEQVADSIRTAGGQARAMELDVSDALSVAECIAKVVGMYGRLDYMFNNAGIIILGEVRDMTMEHWQRIIAVNFLGVLHGTTAAYSQMVKQGYGHIVNVASVAGLVHLPTYTAYSTTKHAVVGLSTSMRPEASRLGVKISVVCPGTMNTGMAAAATILNASRAILDGRKRKMENMDPASAARVVLRGVERNQAVIVFPFSARLLWWIHRLQPALLAPLDRHFVNSLRAAREES